MSHRRGNMARMTFDPHNRRPASHDLFELEQQLIGSLTNLWARGWMPADVISTVAFRRSARVASMAGRLILAEHLAEGYHDRLAPQWQRQLNSLPDQAGSASPLSDLVDSGNATSLMADAIDLHRTFESLPDLRRLCDPPGIAVGGTIRPDSQSRRSSTGAGSAGRSSADHDMLRRVRALLAKAEATEFEAEAEAFTAKAQSLIAAHSLQHLLQQLSNDTAGQDSPATMRIAVERPYDHEKFGLLAEVARANRCRAVLHSGLGLASVMGFELDLEAVELIYTSLLVQATHAMRTHGSQTDGWGGNTTRTFRRSFLRGFSGRVGQRLRDAADEAAKTSAAGSGHDRLLPVLASRATEVESAIEAAFPHLTLLRSRARIDGSGYTAGVRAADRADLGARRPIAS